MARLIRNPIVERLLLSVKTANDWVVAKLVGLFLHIAKKLPPQRQAPAMPLAQLQRRQ